MRTFRHRSQTTRPNPVNDVAEDGVNLLQVINGLSVHGEEAGSEAGSRKQEAGSRKQEAGSRKQEAGSREGLTLD
jgi:hypothetical protein